MALLRRVALLVLLFLGLALVAPACAGDSTAPPETTTTLPSQDVLDCSRPGVTRPNCGTKPQDAGDRGGWLQYLLWALLVAGLTIVFGVVYRSAKRTERAKQVEVGDRNWS